MSLILVLGMTNISSLIVSFTSMSLPGPFGVVQANKKVVEVSTEGKGLMEQEIERG